MYERAPWQPGEPEVSARLAAALRKPERELVFRDSDQFRELGRGESIEIPAEGATDRQPPPVSGQERRGSQALGRRRALDPLRELLDQQPGLALVELDVSEIQVGENFDRSRRMGGNHERLLPPRKQYAQLEGHVHPPGVGEICEAVFAGQHELDDLPHPNFELGLLLRHAGMQPIGRGRGKNGGLEVRVPRSVGDVQEDSIGLEILADPESCR